MNIEHDDDDLRLHHDYYHQIKQQIVFGIQGLPQNHWHMLQDSVLSTLRTTAGLDYKRQWLENITKARFSTTSSWIPHVSPPIAPLPI